jgi:hypothetical protein
MSTATVIIFRPRQEPSVEELGTDLESWQACVGGYVESHRIGDNLHIICNEEASCFPTPTWLKNLQPNRRHPDYGIFMGTFFVMKDDGDGGTASLEATDIQKVLEEAKHHWPLVGGDA